ncbi:MAG: Ig-like domain-containing protein [Bacteroides sp.]|nr:Ig-like domain-containing protein [Eubacterium sp.]MCM1417681.1 Ig-like domain-containing protein [Roseburia sp.]MCM1461853.1 Ig-like domain-containing protein [Bacteroides sp.]
MMKFGRIAALLAAGVMAVAGMTVCAGAERAGEAPPVIASGEEIATYYPQLKTVQKIKQKLGYMRFCADFLSTVLIADSIMLANRRTAEYTLPVAEAGELRIDLNAEAASVYLTVYAPDGEPLPPSGEERSLGRTTERPDGALWLEWDGDAERFAGSVVYPVKKGTYRIVLRRPWYGRGGGSLSFTATYPASPPPGTARLDHFTFIFERWTRLRLGTVLSGESGDPAEEVVWTSSDPSVVSVSPSGKLTCKKRGTATVTATLGDGKLKLKLKITVK